MHGSRPSGVPVIPNESKVRGRLVGVEPETDGYGSVWDIAVDEARVLGDMPNFAEEYVGHTIQVHVGPQLSAPVDEAEELEARVSFRGDERGGQFVLLGEDAHKV